jgi:hypothetical protein
MRVEAVQERELYEFPEKWMLRHRLLIAQPMSRSSSRSPALEVPPQVPDLPGKQPESSDKVQR